LDFWAMPNLLGRSTEFIMNRNGSAERFRTSGGIAESRESLFKTKTAKQLTLLPSTLLPSALCLLLTHFLLPDPENLQCSAIPKGLLIRIELGTPLRSRTSWDDRRFLFVLWRQ